MSGSAGGLRRMLSGPGPAPAADEQPPAVVLRRNMARSVSDSGGRRQRPLSLPLASMQLQVGRQLQVDRQLQAASRRLQVGRQLLQATSQQL